MEASLAVVPKVWVAVMLDSFLKLEEVDGNKLAPLCSPEASPRLPQAVAEFVLGEMRVQLDGRKK